VNRADLTGKKVVVLGLGVSGMAAACLLKKQGADVMVVDENKSAGVLERAGRLRETGVRAEVGAGFRLAGNMVELGILSPGLDPRRPLVSQFSDCSVPVWSELELAYRFCECPMVVITGTNGKTTTTELTHAVLSASGKRSCAAGNIGLALSDVVQKSHEMDVLVVEASSFQLERIVEFHPRVAALLNVTPDHLDRYSGMGEYLAAKMRVFENQNIGDFAVVHASFGDLSLKAKTVRFSAKGHACEYTFESGVVKYKGRAVFSLEQTRLRGLHNAENAMVALAVGHLFGVDESRIVEALAGYRPAPHRCEWVAECGGVQFINDSKGTNGDAVIAALESQSAPVVLIAGGKDKGFDFDFVADAVARKARAVVLIGETAEKIATSWKKTPCVMAGSLAEAVKIASQKALPGDVVMLSPGCSSFDMFRDYADRGNQFKELVSRLKSKQL